jgi:hypothetical protein
MKIDFVSGERIEQVVPSAVTFTAYGLYLDGQLPRLVPWAQVREIRDAEHGEIWRLIEEAQSG